MLPNVLMYLEIVGAVKHKLDLDYAASDASLKGELRRDASPQRKVSKSWPWLVWALGLGICCQARLTIDFGQRRSFWLVGCGVGCVSA